MKYHMNQKRLDLKTKDKAAAQILFLQKRLDPQKGTELCESNEVIVLVVLLELY